MNDFEMVNELLIRYEGLDADRNQMNIGHLGQSLIGIDRLLNAGFHVLESGHLPARRTPRIIETEVGTWKHGSFEFPILLRKAVELAPILQDPYTQQAVKIARNWLSGVFLGMSGRCQESKEHVSRALEIMDRFDQRGLLASFEIIENGSLFLSAKRAVRPIGPSAERMLIQDEDGQTEIDVPMAETLRTNGKVKVEKMETLDLQVDGFTHHNRQLKVRNPDVRGKFSTAVVRDPEFDLVPNVYTQAASEKGWISAEVKVSRYKSGEIHTIYVLNAVRSEREN